MKYYVSASAAAPGNGTEAQPFLTISQAAATAQPGDEIIVRPGIYREHVNPPRGGESDEKRIVYRAEQPGTAIITGAEPLRHWQQHGENVWTASVDNTIFGDRNPYTEVIAGDWFIAKHPHTHTGEVYLDGKSLYEVETYAEVAAPEETEGSWDKIGSLLKWTSVQEAGQTVFYANFGALDPNAHNVEINVRKYVFFPEETGRNYITVNGFVLKQAATNWAPPTAFQEGLIGPHWSKGWIIEDCLIMDSKCSGISLGKCWHPSNNRWTTRKDKSGTQNERDLILYAQHTGWSRERVGSHIVRRNTIRSCGQCGIVGHLGCVFSLIEDNEIYDISRKFEFAGAELGGIKLHAAIDTVIRRNHIHHCYRGLWLDWQAQGTRVSQNVFAYNAGDGKKEKLASDYSEDIHIEVSHGPCLIDNNFLLSPFPVLNRSQGTAFVHNVFYGPINTLSVYGRFTPYHFPHDTDVAGYMTFLFGDDRYYNNIFVERTQKVPCKPVDTSGETNLTVIEARSANMHQNGGLKQFSDYPFAEEYFSRFREAVDNPLGPALDYDATLPIYLGGNVYMNGANPHDRETAVYRDGASAVTFDVCFDENGCTITTDLYDRLPSVLDTRLYGTDTLGEAFEPEQKFENPDGTPLEINADLLGEHRSARPTPGPVEHPVHTLQLPKKGAFYLSRKH